MGRFQEKHSHDTKDFVFGIWKEAGMASKLEHKDKQHQQHVQRMKDEEAGRQLEKLERVADNHAKKHDEALLQVVQTEWHKTASKERAQREKNKDKEELEAMRSQMRDK